jgi:hypothetical protein
LTAPALAFDAGMLALCALIAIVVQGFRRAAPTPWLVPAFAFALHVVGGLARGTKNVLIRTLIHERRVPAQLDGRAYAAYDALRNRAELFALIAGGLLVSALGAPSTLFFAGALPVVAGLVALGLTRRRLVEPAVAGARA